MKSTKTIKRLAAVLSSAFLLFAVSCKNGVEPENAKVRFSVSQDVRTVLPQIDVSDFTDLKLSEKGEGKNTLLGSYSTLKELTDAELEMTSGDYTFILTANDKGTTLSGTTAVTIVKGDNAVSFNMQISDYGTENGSVEITLIIPTTDDLLEAQYEFVNVDDDSIYYDATIGEQTISKEAGTSSVPLTIAAVKPGTYQLKLTYCIDSDNYVSYSTIVRVSAGAVSKGEFECEGIVNDPVEWPEILDLRNVFEYSDEEEGSRRIKADNRAKNNPEQFSAKANMEMHASFIGKEEYKTTKPVNDEDLIKNSVKNLCKNPQNFTEDEINSMFVFEPVSDGVQITVNVPDTVFTSGSVNHTAVRLIYIDGDVPEDGVHYGTVEQYDRTHHLSTTQEVTLTGTEKTKTWIYPLLDPTRPAKKVRFQAQLAPNYEGSGEVQYSNIYDVYYGGGIGCIADLPYGWEIEKSRIDYANIDWTGDGYAFEIKNTKVPERTDKCPIKNVYSTVCFFGTTNDSTYFSVDENGNAEYMAYISKSYPMSEGEINKIVFDNHLQYNGLVIEEPYFWMYMGYTYELDSDKYEGTFTSPVVSTPIIRNDQYFNNLDDLQYPEYEDISDEYSEYDGGSESLNLSLLEGYKDDYCLIIEAEHLAASTTSEENSIWIHSSDWYTYWNDSLIKFEATDKCTVTKKILVSDLLNLYDGKLYLYGNTSDGKWAIKYYLSKRSTDVATVSFANDAADAIKVCTGTDITSKLPELASTDNDNPFVEWYTDEACTKKFTGTVTGDTTLYYKWTDTKDIMYLLTSDYHLYKEDLTPYKGRIIQYTVHHAATDSEEWAGFLGSNWDGDSYADTEWIKIEQTKTYSHTLDDDLLGKTCLTENNKEFYNFNFNGSWTLESLTILKE